MPEFISWGVGIFGTGMVIYFTGYRIGHSKNGFVKRNEFNDLILKMDTNNGKLHGKINKIAETVYRIEGRLERE